MNRQPRLLELLAPARNADIAIAAIDHGADAVYIGAAHHGARHAAGNSIDDIRRVVDHARLYDARVYVTLNTLVYDDELTAVERLATSLYHAGVDALIVQDMSLLRLDLPPIALHASTQCDIRTPHRARFLQDAGFSQLVLARELTLDEISAIRSATTVPLEAFVHGALCVSYSGNCQASCMATGRSANRGECAQMCRLPYDLIDGNGNRVLTGKHLLSLRDMNRIESLSAMIDAGIDSFKIEGRLKDADYVKTVVSAYSDRLDAIIAARGDGMLRRRSRGRVTRSFTPALDLSFNRGYTDYFLHRRRPGGLMAGFDTPKSAGTPVATVTRSIGRTLTIKSDTTLANGDGLTYFDPRGELHGFRLNRVDGNTLYPASPVSIKPGTRLYRNHDARREALMARTDTARRVIDVTMTLRTAADGRTLALDIAMAGDGQGAAASVTLDAPPDKARSPQHEVRRNTLAKLGDTPYSLARLDDRIDGNTFVPLSVLTSLRRDAVAALDAARRASAQLELRRRPASAPALGRTGTDYTDNIANRVAADFYREAGAMSISPAIELEQPAGRTRVMLTRYCLRRELGRCLRTPDGSGLAGPLTLRGIYGDMPLEFDCANCEMSVFFDKK